MLVFRDISTLQNHLNNLKSKEKIIGFIPTMGALHNGHLSLVNKSVSQNDFPVVFFLINPTQFNNVDDLKTYPSDIDKDLELLRSISDKIIVFNPESDELYAGDIKPDQFNFNELDRYMEGEFRGNHFAGVATVVSKLFSLIKADYAYFGEKDFQQLQIITNWVKTADISTAVVPCPIVREANGLAMSSRNELLSKKTRKEAGFIYNTLKYCVTNGLQKAAIYSYIVHAFGKHPTFTLHYALCVNEDTLKEVYEVNTKKKQRIFVATTVEGVRLIDNIALK